VIPSNTVNLPVCALGAGVAHAAALTLVLPLMITLPAPGESSTTELVAIPVEIVATAAPRTSVAPAPSDLIGALMESAGEGGPSPESAEPASSDLAIPAETESTDDVTAALSEDVTGALPGPSVTETAPAAELPAPDSGMEVDAQDEPIQDESIQEEPAPAEVANVDAVMPPLPTRVRRDNTGEAIIQSRSAPPPVQEARPVRRAPPPKRGLFGLAKPPRAPVAKAGDAAPYKGSWDTLLGKPAL
jgi:hypothetical protein